jgi:hypothetical protein
MPLGLRPTSLAVPKPTVLPRRAVRLFLVIGLVPMGCEDGLRLRGGTNVRWLVDEGFTAFEMRHGSAPKFVLPEVLGEVREAVLSVETTAPEYGVDPDRLRAWRIVSWPAPDLTGTGHLEILEGFCPVPGGRPEVARGDRLSREGSRSPVQGADPLLHAARAQGTPAPTREVGHDPRRGPS